MGRFGITEILVLLAIVLIFVLVPVLCYKAGKKRGFEIGKNTGFKEGLEYNKN